MFPNRFRHIRTFQNCFWFCFAGLLNRSASLLKPNDLFSPSCFNIKGRLQDLIDYSSRHAKKFRFLGFESSCILLLYRLWCRFRIFTVFLLVSCLDTCLGLVLWVLILLCIKPKLWNKVWLFVLEGNFYLLCLRSDRSLGQWLTIRIVRWDLRSRSS